MKYKVGMEVYCPIHGKGKIINISKVNLMFPIKVQFNNYCERYTKDGRMYIGARYKSILKIIKLKERRTK